MKKKSYAVMIRGEKETWAIQTRATRETAEEWRADGLEVRGPQTFVPAWVVWLGLLRVWLFFADLWPRPVTEIENAAHSAARGLSAANGGHIRPGAARHRPSAVSASSACPPSSAARDGPRSRGMNAFEVWLQSDGEVTKAFYRRLEEECGTAGLIAMNLFRANKASTRAKAYRGRSRDGRGSYRSLAYQKKDWSLGQLCAALTANGGAEGLAWGWKRDEGEPFHNEVLYVDLPQGQVSFHSSHRGEGPDYPGEWDGKKESTVRICAYADRLLRLADIRRERKAGRCLGELFDMGYTAEEQVDAFGVAGMAAILLPEESPHDEEDLRDWSYMGDPAEPFI